MPDEMEHAQWANEDFQAFVLGQQQHNRELLNYTGSDCIECGEEIPAKRKAAQPGCCRCIECQTEFEQGNNHGTA